MNRITYELQVHVDFTNLADAQAAQTKLTDMEFPGQQHRGPHPSRINAWRNPPPEGKPRP